MWRYEHAAPGPNISSGLTISSTALTAGAAHASQPGRPACCPVSGRLASSPGPFRLRLSPALPAGSSRAAAAPEDTVDERSEDSFRVLSDMIVVAGISVRRFKSSVAVRQLFTRVSIPRWLGEAFSWSVFCHFNWVKHLWAHGKQRPHCSGLCVVFLLLGKRRPRSFRLED